MKKLKRLVTDPNTKKIKMKTLYEYPAKVGTTGSTIVWLLEEAKKGDVIYGFCLENKYSPYMPGQAFRYAKAYEYIVEEIQPRRTGEFLVLSKH